MVDDDPARRGGPRRPGFDARRAPLPRIGPDQPARRYADISGDWSAHHFDIEVARSSGFDYLFAHGLCTMAMCTHRVLDAIGGGDPGRVRRVAVRFASPTPLGADLTVSTYDIDEHAFAFDARCGAAEVITHGRLELRR
jgi:acyl dehydratase